MITNIVGYVKICWDKKEKYLEKGKSAILFAYIYIWRKEIIRVYGMLVYCKTLYCNWQTANWQQLHTKADVQEIFGDAD